MIVQRLVFRYLKKSGVLKIPPKIWESSREWIRAHIASDLLSDAEKQLQDPYLGVENRQTLGDRIPLLKAMLLPRIQIKPFAEVRRKVPVNLTGWEYLPKINATEGAMDRIQEQIPYFTLVLTQRTLVGGRAQAYWNTAKHVLTVQYPPRDFGVAAWGDLFEKSFDRLLSRIYKDLRHEMTHLTQTVLQVAFDKPRGKRIEQGETPPLPGLPSSSIMTPQFLQELSSLSKKDQRKYQYLITQIQDLLKMPVNYVDAMRIHTLDDVEFYSKLGDEIEDFNANYRNVTDPQQRREVFKSWVGATIPKGLMEMLYSQPSKTFLVWRTHAKDKWKKAVKEMAKVVL